MRKLLLSTLLAVLVLVAVPHFGGEAQALVFSDTIDFVGNFAPTYGYTFFRVFDNAGFSWTHNINDNLGGNSIGGVTLLNAVLQVTFANTNDGGERWGLSGLGPLVTAFGNAPNVLLFNLNPAQLADLTADGLFSIKPFETTGGRDVFRLIDATLSGNFLPPHSPEPATLFLLTSGLGLGFLRRKKV